MLIKCQPNFEKLAKIHALLTEAEALATSLDATVNDTNKEYIVKGFENLSDLVYRNLEVF